MHDDCKGHTRYFMTLVKGDLTIFSIKKNMKGKSFAEDELVGADDTVP